MRNVRLWSRCRWNPARERPTSQWVGRRALAPMLAFAVVLGTGGPAIAAAQIGVVAMPAARHGYVPPHNPPKDVWPKPDYTFPVPATEYFVGQPLPACWRWQGDSMVAQPTATKCIETETTALDAAHKGEKIGRFIFPRNFAKLTPAEQLFVLVDLERVSRGEAPMVGLSHTVDRWAQAGAKANGDPVPDGHLEGATGAFASNWAAAINTFDADYSWMYVDGWDGKHKTLNGDCTSAKAPGCWGHRDNILVNTYRLPCYFRSCSYVMGGGYVKNGWRPYSSFSELFIQVTGKLPSLYYTWADAVKEGAR